MAGKHSPLGASGAERWMNCPGSVALLAHFGVPDEDDEDYRVNGTTAHSFAAYLMESGKDAWEVVGWDCEETKGVFDADMAVAVQTYLDVNRALLTPTSTMFIEHHMHHTDVHPLFFGTIDCGIIDGHHLHVNDYKHGEGIFVEAVDNVQLLYYAYGMLLHPDCDGVQTVTMRIIQPRITWAEPVREWTVSADYVRTWAREVLVPAMLRATTDKVLAPGQWCRFCPVKLECPVLKSLYRAAAAVQILTEDDVAALTRTSNEALALDYNALEVVKMYEKAVAREAYNRLAAGVQVPGLKLVAKKADRVWKDGAAERFEAKLGEKAFTTPMLKSPAVMEKIDGAAELVKEWSFKPQTGLTVAMADDKRAAVQVTPPSETFAKAAREQGLIE